MQKHKSKESLITDNLRLVHSLCRRFTDKGIEYDDLFQSGCIGLIKAANGFDFSRGLCFSTYAVPVVLGEIKRLFRDGGAVKVSRHLKELFLKLNTAASLFEKKNGREATLTELAKTVGCSLEEATEAVCACRPTVSLTVENEEGISELDLPENGPEVTLADKLLLDDAFVCLDNNEKTLIQYRYYRGLTQSDTAVLMNMTQVQVSRAEKKILAKLRIKLGE